MVEENESIKVMFSIRNILIKEFVILKLNWLRLIKIKIHKLSTIRLMEIKSKLNPVE